MKLEGTPSQERRFVALWHRFYGKRESLRPSRAIPELVALHEEGYLPATHRLAMSYYDGAGVKRDRRRAADLFRDASERGCASSQLMLGTMLQTGAAGGVEKDEQEAVRRYREAAQQGIGAAQHNLANMLLNGWGGAVDPIEAYAWHSLSLEHEATLMPWRRGTERLLVELEDQLSADELEDARGRVEAAREGLLAAADVDVHLYWKRLVELERTTAEQPD